VKTETEKNLKLSNFILIDNQEIATKTYRLVLVGDTDGIDRPGQFVNLTIPGFFLRRPFSVSYKEDDRLTIIYKVVGHGTEFLSKMKVSANLNVLKGLGNGYNLTKAGANPGLIGGGAGIPPLYWLAKELVDRGQIPHVILGFNRKEEIFLKDDFEKLGCEVFITTVDGSVGLSGMVTDGLKKLKDLSYLYVCGPPVMLKAIALQSDCDGQFSLESRMGCGYGACMGCSLRTVNGPKRICKDGPVFEKGEIEWTSFQ